MEQLKEQLLEIHELQSRFTYATGSDLRIPLNYDPAIEWWNFHRSDIDLKNIRQYGIKQIESTLKERLSASKNLFVYTFDQDGEMINNLLPTEKFRKVLERGIAYRKDIGSIETERESAELHGFLKINKKLQNKETSVGTKMIVISGTGIVEETAYKFNYVDIYEKSLDQNGKVVIIMTRFTSSCNYEDYVNKALLFNLNYIDSFEGPIDAWFLSHPISVAPQDKFQTSEELFSKIFNRGETSIEEDVFQEILEYCMPLIQNYINILCSDNFDPQKIAIAFNAILNKADNFDLNDKKENRYYINVQEEAVFLGMQTVRSVSAICGLSIGFGNNRFENSVAKFGLNKEKWVENCGNCGKEIKAYISKGYQCSCGGVYEGC